MSLHLNGTRGRVKPPHHFPRQVMLASFVAALLDKRHALDGADIRPARRGGLRVRTVTGHALWVDARLALEVLLLAEGFSFCVTETGPRTLHFADRRAVR